MMALLSRCSVILTRLGWTRRRMTRRAIGLAWLPLVAAGLVVHSVSGDQRFPAAAIREARRERAHVIATGRVSGGPPFAIVYECKHAGSEGGCRLTAVVTGPNKPAFLTNGGNVTLEVRAHHVPTAEVGVQQACAGRQKIVWVLGVLRTPADQAFVRAKSGQIAALRRVHISGQGRVAVTVVYRVMRRLPLDVTARTSDGRRVANRDNHGWWASEKVSCPNDSSVTIGTIE